MSRSRSTGTAGHAGRSSTRIIITTRASSRNGNVVLLCARPIPPALHPRVKGGLPGTEIDGRMYADYLVEMTTRGEVVWEWRSWEHLDFETEVITLQDRREEWTHANTVAELPDGDLVVSFRNISTVAIVESPHRRDRLEARRRRRSPSSTTPARCRTATS